MPADEGLNHATCLDDFGLGVLGLGQNISFEEFFGFVQTKVQNNTSSSERHDGILLKLVAHNWGVRVARGANSESLLRINDRASN